MKYTYKFNRYFKTNVISILLFLITSIFVFTPVVYLQINKDRIKEFKIGNHSNLPIEIIKVKSKIGEVKPNEIFSANEDWFKEFAIEIQNKSTNPITYISLALIFSRPEEQGELDYATSLEFGSNPFEKEDSLVAVSPVQLQEKVQIKLTDEKYNETVKDLRNLNFPETIKKVKLLVDMIGFEDGTIWISGKIYKQDKNNPGKLIQLSKKRSLAVNEVNTNCVQINGFEWIYCPWNDHDGTRCRLLSLTYDNSGTEDKVNRVQSRCKRDPSRGLCVDTRTQERVLLEDCVAPTPTPTQTPTPTPGGGNPTYECDPFCQGNGLTENSKSDDNASSAVDSCCILTPIVVDIDGDGFNLTSASNGVMFDFNGDGIPHRISWTKRNSDEAWLVLDRNGNGTIDNGSELFGNMTPQPQAEQKHGFLALSEYDKLENGGNEDGKINKLDAIFTDLRLWQDKNHNGISERSELKKLRRLDVKAFMLNYKTSKRADRHGNEFRYKAKVKDTRDGNVGKWAWDVFLVLDEEESDNL